MKIRCHLRNSTGFNNSKMAPKTYLWTDSNGSEWHKLPKYLKKYIKKRKFCIKAEPGRKMSKSLIDEIKKEARKKQHHILMLGMQSQPYFTCLCL